MKILRLGLLLSLFAAALSGYAAALSDYSTASDQYDSEYLKQLEVQRQNAIAHSCRDSLPATPERTYYNVDGVLLEARDYCMFLAVQYVRGQLRSPAPPMATANRRGAGSADHFVSPDRLQMHGESP